MSELPNFKEGFIFDATQNNDAEHPFIITESKPRLFKIASLSDYSKDYKYWHYFRSATGSDDTETKVVSSVKTLKSYNTKSFITTINNNSSAVIAWKNSIYLYLGSNSFISGYEDFEYHLTRCANGEGTKTYDDTKTIYVKKAIGITPLVSYDNDDITLKNNGYEITINNPVTTLDWIYYNVNKSDDELKYYQFSLYNSQNKCVVDTGKVYTDIAKGNGFVCNSLDDDSTYTLVGYCVSQNGLKLDLPDLTIKTAYTTGKIYANLTIELDKHLAQNTVHIEVVNLVGKTTNGKVVYIDNEMADLKTYDNSVVFTDNYDYLLNNFLIRLWINGIKNKEEKVSILKLSNPKTSDYIELYYRDGYFYAVKHSCGLTSQYISNAVDKNDVLNGNIYISILYCNGRIDIYAISYTESEGTS